MTSIIGIDFDNTIVCYDNIFYQVALEKELIPPATSTTKEGVRNYLRAMGKEDLWTELQGYVYGARMKDVPPFPGVVDFFTSAIEKDVQVYIISHKTRYPYKGPKYDLHKSAYEWLESQGFFDKNGIGLSSERVFFEEAKEGKLSRISNIGCSHFIDDLPEFLMEEGFSKKAERLLFAPNLSVDHSMDAVIRIVRSWSEISSYFGIH